MVYPTSPANLPVGPDTPPVVCIGETMVMLASDERGLRRAQTVEVHVAGAESNVAAALAQLGHRVEWFGRLGDDAFGGRILDDLARLGVTTDRVIVDAAAATGVYFKDSLADSSAVLYYRRGSAATRMSPDDVPRLELGGRRLIHITGIAAALSPSVFELTRALLRDMSGVVTTSFDVNFRPALWSRAEAAPILRELANLADIVFVGRDEAETLWQTATVEAVRETLDAPHTLVVKDSHVGATSFVGVDRFDAPALSVDVLEPIGAGDAFAAGYLDGVIRDAPPLHSLRMGHLMAAHALRHRGDMTPVLHPERLRQVADASDGDWHQLHFGADSEPRDGADLPGAESGASS